MEKNEIGSLIDDLAFNDICARIPYGLKIERIYKMNGKRHQETIDIDIENVSVFFEYIEKDWYESVKPVLRPIADMTQAEVNKVFDILNIDEEHGDWLKVNDIGILRLFTEVGKDLYEIAAAMDYLNKIHVDYRNLIEKGLAVKASKGTY